MTTVMDIVISVPSLPILILMSRFAGRQDLAAYHRWGADPLQLALARTAGKGDVAQP